MLVCPPTEVGGYESETCYLIFSLVPRLASLPIPVPCPLSLVPSIPIPVPCPLSLVPSMSASLLRSRSLALD
jgi:hypothetical protein